MFIGAGPRSVARVTTSFGPARSIGELRWVRLISFSRSLATAHSSIPYSHSLPQVLRRRPLKLPSADRLPPPPGETFEPLVPWPRHGSKSSSTVTIRRPRGQPGREILAGQ